jgi:hypothetical protein
MTPCEILIEATKVAIQYYGCDEPQSCRVPEHQPIADLARALRAVEEAGK